MFYMVFNLVVDKRCCILVLNWRVDNLLHIADLKKRGSKGCSFWDILNSLEHRFFHMNIRIICTSDPCFRNKFVFFSTLYSLWVTKRYMADLPEPQHATAAG